MTPAAAPAHPELPGLTFVHSLGVGGYAEVHLYEQDNTRLRVAVKVLFKDQLTDSARRQFEAEARAMAELADHPFIVQVFQADVTADGRPYLVMKYYPNSNLAARAEAERLSVPEVLQIGVRITCAVETAHRAGILHRDIKPHNILTSQYGEPGLTDFGIATRGEVDADGELPGLSIPWSAPEVVFAQSPGDRTADIYSLGATLWHLLVGRSPFEVPHGDNSTPALMHRIREAPVTRTGRDDVPPSLERLLAQAMAKEPRDRPQTALELALALQAIEGEQRWTPTPLALLQHAPSDPPSAGAGPDAGTESGGAGVDDGLATRRRQPQVVVTHAPTPRVGAAAVAQRAATGPVAPGTAIASAAAKAGWRQRQGVPEQPQDPPTVRRPVAVSARPSRQAPDLPGGELDAPDAEPEAARGAAGDVASAAVAAAAPRSGAPRRRLRLVASAAVALAVAGVAAYLAGHSGSRNSHSGGAPATSAAPSPPPSLVSAPPAGPQVTGTRVDPGHVRFSWSEAGASAGDRFYWKEAGGTMHQATSSSVTLAVPAPQRACITVEVVRGDAYADSPLTCAG